MDKETLSQYGWIVICIIIIALMLGLATPFGKYVGDATLKAMDSFRSKTETTLGIESNSGEVEEPTEPEDSYPETTPEMLANMTFVLNEDGKSYTITKFKGSGEVVVPKEYEGLPVTIIGSDSFRENYSLTSVTLSKNITDIGVNAFYRCEKLISITIPENVAVIESSAFSGCSKLASITIDAKLNSIGNNAFRSISTSLSTINYNHTMNDWKQIKLDYSWKMGAGFLTTVHCTDGDIAL